MRIYKFYDAACDNCGEWYGSSFPQPQVTNQKLAILQMKEHGWTETFEKTLCHKCNELESKGGNDG